MVGRAEATSGSLPSLQQLDEYEELAGPVEAASMRARVNAAADALLDAIEQGTHNQTARWADAVLVQLAHHRIDRACSLLQARSDARAQLARDQAAVAPVPRSAPSGSSPAGEVLDAQTELTAALRPVVAARLEMVGMPAPNADLQGSLRAMLDQRGVFEPVLGDQFGLVDAVRHDRNRVAHAAADFSADDAARALGRIEALLEAIGHTGAQASVRARRERLLKTAGRFG